MRTLEEFRLRIREELRAEGVGGGGYSDNFIRDALNSAQQDLAALFTFRDIATFDTTETAEEWTLDLGGAAGGTYELGIENNMVELAFDATAAQIESALEDVFGDDNVTVAVAADFGITFTNAVRESGFQADFSDLVGAVDPALTQTQEYLAYDYDLPTVVTTMVIENILRITYDGKPLAGIPLDAFLAKTAWKEGSVDQWVLWGSTLTLIGRVVENVEVRLWVTRAPTDLENDPDESELPYYAQEAMIQYAISACYRESRDYERAGYHLSLYQREYADVRSRAISQGQRDHLPTMRDSYGGPISQRDGIARSDTNPGGRTD